MAIFGFALATVSSTILPFSRKYFCLGLIIYLTYRHLRLTIFLVALKMEILGFSFLLWNISGLANVPKVVIRISDFVFLTGLLYLCGEIHISPSCIIIWCISWVESRNSIHLRDSRIRYPCSYLSLEYVAALRDRLF